MDLAVYHFLVRSVSEVGCGIRTAPLFGYFRLVDTGGIFGYPVNASFLRPRLHLMLECKSAEFDVTLGCLLMLVSCKLARFCLLPLSLFCFQL